MAKEELNKSLKCTTSSRVLNNLTIQDFNNEKDLCYVKKDPSNNLHNKYVTMSDNFLCIHCGRNEHIKMDCPACKRDEESLLKYVIQKKFKRNLVLF